MASHPQNLLLEALSPASRERLLALAKHVDLPLRAHIQAPGEFPQYAYFFTQGIASFVVQFAEGGSAEVALMGHEGLSCSLPLLGPAKPEVHAFMQMEGAAYRIPFAQMKEIFLESEEIRTRILEHVQQLTLTSTQIVACNRLHETEPRLARWLLMVQDRVEENIFQLTQEFIAEMLGTQRTTVAIAAGLLQRTGVIEYKRGRVTIADRAGLEEMACDCYPVVKRYLANLYNSTALQLNSSTAQQLNSSTAQQLNSSTIDA
jgi:CRP-like cAMP-binding protein